MCTSFVDLAVLSLEIAQNEVVSRELSIILSETDRSPTLLFKIET